MVYKHDEMRSKEKSTCIRSMNTYWDLYEPGTILGAWNITRKEFII